MPATPKHSTVSRPDEPTTGLPVLARLVSVGVVIAAAALILGFAVVGRHGGGPIRSWDDTVGSWFLHHRAHLVGASKMIAVVGDAAGLGVIAIVLTIGLLALRRLGIRALMPILAYLGGEALIYFVRLFIHRPRPSTADFPAPGAVRGIHETSYSFPSGHATAGAALLFALAGLIVLTRRAWWPWVLAALLTFAVVSSRLVLGVHWFSDVAFGMVLGAAWGISLFAVFRQLSWSVIHPRLERLDPSRASTSGLHAARR